MEFIKMRAQVASESLRANRSISHLSKEIYKERGIRTFYTGLDAALVRQSIYSSLRIGLFFNISDYMRMKRDGRYTNTTQKIVASVSAGIIAAIIANPCDVAMIRMQGDGTLPS